MPRTRWIATLMLMGTLSSATGREVTVKLTATEAEKVPFLTPLLASGATTATVGDAHNLIAIGNKVEKAGQITLYKLDDLGKLAGAPISVNLPRPASVAQRETYALSIVFHPSLPLMYVWQEVEKLKGDPIPPLDPAWKDFDHLLIYSVEKALPQLLLGLCRGTGFHTGTVGGSLHLDLPHGRLFVPNLRFGEKNPPEGGGGVGWFHLGGDGLPVAGDREPEKPEPVATVAKAAADRAGRVAVLAAAAATGKPLGAFRHTPEKNYGFGDFPAGAGFIIGSRDVFIACGSYGAVTWNLADRRARAQFFLLPVNFTVYNMTRLTGHPTLPVAFFSFVGYSYAHRIEHVDGFLTLVPQILLLDGATIKTPPIVLTKRNLVAWGGPSAIYLAPIDAEGKFKEGAGTLVTVVNTSTEGLAYSERFDRLYVAVEKLK